jgi:hypothetical protein
VFISYKVGLKYKKMVDESGKMGREIGMTGCTYHGLLPPVLNNIS